MAAVSILIGKRYGRLVILERAETVGKWKSRRFKCRCDCGVEKVVYSTSLRSGTTQSCGCYARERSTTHGMVGKPEYETWAALCQRFKYTESKQYQRLKEQGITIDPRWLENIDAFLADVGMRPHPDCKLFRIDRKIGFWKDNVEWRFVRGAGKKPTARSKVLRPEGVLPPPDPSIVPYGRDFAYNQDLTGHQYNSLTVLEQVADNRPTVRKGFYWKCQCVCGTTAVVEASALRSGNTKSCGCALLGINETHGESLSPEYDCWRRMVASCTFPTHRSYAGFQLKGITLNPEWMEIENFLRDMGRKPSLVHTLHRKDQTKGFNRENCVWRVPSEMAIVLPRKDIKAFGEILTEHRFGQLTVIDVYHGARYVRGHKDLWACLCDCGKNYVAGAVELLEGTVTHCGCQGHSESFVRAVTKEPEYKVWKGMMNSCRHPSQNLNTRSGKG